MILNEFGLGQWTSIFLIFFFFTLKVFVSLKIEEIYTMDNKIG